jgi:hypothetical protein
MLVDQVLEFAGGLDTMPRKQPSVLRQILNVVLSRRSGNALQQTSQGTSSPQGTSSHSAESAMLPVQPDIFERVEEYRAILEHQAQLSARRQHANDVYIGLNTIFLTALGVLLLQSHLNTWWVFAVVCAMTIIVLPINFTWRAALLRYETTLAEHFDYLREIEQEFRTRRGNVANQPEIGLILKRKDTHQKSNTQLEKQLATYFICLYPVISLVC